MLYLIIAVLIAIVSWGIGVGFGYGAARIDAKGLKEAEGVLNDIRRWAMKNGDVFPEASVTVGDMVADYYENKEN